jgi:DNA-binding transcriptional regulator YiaG
LGAYIRKHRKEKGLLIREFAKKLGIQEFTLIKWEDGKRLLHPRYLNNLKRVIPGLAAVAKDSYSNVR